MNDELVECAGWMRNANHCCMMTNTGTVTLNYNFISPDYDLSTLDMICIINLIRDSHRSGNAVMSEIGRSKVDIVVLFSHHVVHIKWRAET